MQAGLHWYGGGLEEIHGSMVLLDTCQAHLQVLQVLDILGSSGQSQELILLSTEYSYTCKGMICMVSQSCCVYRNLLSAGLNLKKFLKRRLGLCTAAASATELLPEACSLAMPPPNCTDPSSYCS